MTKLSWIALPLALYLGWLAAAFLAQRRIVFPRHLLSPARGGERSAPPPGVERVALSTSAGEVEAWFIPSGGSDTGNAGASGGPSDSTESSGSSDSYGAGAPAVVFAHGNAELARDWVGAYRALAREGLAVLLVEYPGYGDSEGAPSLESVREAMVAAWEHLAARPGIDGDRIVGLGRSLGGGAVTALARERPLAALILQSTFTDVRRLARGLLVPGFLVRDPFDNLAVVRDFDGPVLVLHGRRDDVIPFSHGERLARAAPDGRLVVWPCGHNDCPPDWAEYLKTLTGFLREGGLLRGS